MKRDETNPQLQRRDLLRGAVALAGGYTLTRIFLPGVAWGAYREREVKAPVKLTGRLTYDGPIPKPIMKDVTSDFAVAGKEPRVWEGLSIGTEKGIKDAVVVVTGAMAGKPFVAQPPVTYVKGAVITPRVEAFAWKEDMTLDLENRDPILHSWQVRMNGEVKDNKAHPSGVAKVSTTVRDPGLYELNCAPHPWERAFRMAVPHPYFTKTGEDGRFEIDGLPRGDYTVVVWAEGFAPKRIWSPAYEDTVKLDRAFGADDIGAALRGQK